MSRLGTVHKGVTDKPLRFLLYGVEGIGKSELAAQFPNPIFLAAEDGVSHIDTTSIVPTGWLDAIAILSELFHDPHEYKTLVVDTCRWLEGMCSQYVCELNKVPSLAHIGYGKGGPMVLAEFQKGMQWLSALRNQRSMNIVLVGHADVKKFGNPEGDDYDRYSLLMDNKKLAEELKQWADIVGFYNFDATVSASDGMGTGKATSLGQRLMHLERSVAYDAKNRFKMRSPLDMGASAGQGFEKLMAEYNKRPGASPAAAAAPTTPGEQS